MAKKKGPPATPAGRRHIIHYSGWIDSVGQLLKEIQPNDTIVVQTEEQRLLTEQALQILSPDVPVTVEKTGDLKIDYCHVE